MMQLNNDFQGQELNPNNPKVFNDPDLIRLLDPRQQTIALINLVETGQSVNSDPIRTIEALMKAAGYDGIQMNGQLDAGEMLAYADMKKKMNDEEFKETAIEWIGTIKDTLLNAQGEPVSLMAMMSQMFKQPDPNETTESQPTRGRTFQQGAQAKLISDPD